MKTRILLLLMLLCLMMNGCKTAVSAEAETAKSNPNKTQSEQQEKVPEEEQKIETDAAKENADKVKEVSAKAEENKVEEAGKKAAADKAEETKTEAENAADIVKTDNEKEADTTKEDSPGEVTEQVTSFEQPKTLYATAAVNVRRGPSTEYEVIAHLVTAQQIEATGQAETGWYQMMTEGEPVYVSNQYLSETKPEPTPEPTTPSPQPEAAQQPASQQPEAAQSAQQVTVAPAGVIMVGDSRCVQMQEAVGGGGCMWICENSKEYTWFVEKAIPNFDKHVGKGTKVVINLGVNDPEHYNQYVATINAKAAEWAQRGAQTYLVSVNPVWENPYTTKEQVDTFNANVPGMLVGVTWIDTHTWLVENGYRVLDGLHYDASTYINIYNLIMGSL